METKILEQDVQETKSAYTYSGFENAETAKHLRDGETCKVTGIGNSMTPILKSRQPVICTPVTDETELKKRDIVLCKVKGYFYICYCACRWYRVHITYTILLT